MVCVGRFLKKLHFMTRLNWLLQRVGSNRVAGASTKAPDSGEQPSATQAPGAEQVEHTSSATSESGEVKDAPRLESHVVDLFSPGTAVTTAALSRKVLELGPAAFVLGVVVFRHAGSNPNKLCFQLGLDA